MLFCFRWRWYTETSLFSFLCLPRMNLASLALAHSAPASSMCLSITFPLLFSQNIPVPDDFFRFSRKYLEYSLVFQWKPGLSLMVASLEYTWPLTCACLEHSWSPPCAFLGHHRPLTCAWPWRTRPLPCAWRWQIWPCPCLGPTAPCLSLV
jgi:hypothetical protein